MPRPMKTLMSAVLLFSGFILMSPVNAKTSMEVITKEYDLKQCRDQLIILADELIGEKEHRLHVDQPKGHQDKYPLVVVGVVSYNDRDAHVNFSASPFAKDGCEVNYEESFVLPESCLVAREQVFKKWKFVGKLSEDSFFLRHKKRLTKNATLTSLGAGSGCLVTRRNSGI